MEDSIHGAERISTFKIQIGIEDHVLSEAESDDFVEAITKAFTAYKELVL